MRRYTFCCSHCPTNVHVETELPTSVQGELANLGDQVYTPEMGVGGNSRNGDFEVADLCPACGFPMHYALLGRA